MEQRGGEERLVDEMNDTFVEVGEGGCGRYRDGVDCVSRRAGVSWAVVAWSVVLCCVVLCCAVL